MAPTFNEFQQGSLRAFTRSGKELSIVSCAYGQKRYPVVAESDSEQARLRSEGRVPMMRFVDSLEFAFTQAPWGAWVPGKSQDNNLLLAFEEEGAAVFFRWRGWACCHAQLLEWQIERDSPLVAIGASKGTIWPLPDAHREACIQWERTCFADPGACIPFADWLRERALDEYADMVLERVTG